MAGFEATIVSSDARVSGDHIVLQIEGMSCSSCSTAVEKALQAIHGVQAASVNLLAGKAEVDILISSHNASGHFPSVSLSAMRSLPTI